MSDPVAENRPPESERWHYERTEPVRFEVSTQWLYGEADPRATHGRKHWAFARSGRVARSDVPSSYEHMQDVASHLHRAIEAFGDDVDLIVEVRRADARPALVDPGSGDPS